MIPNRIGDKIMKNKKVKEAIKGMDLIAPDQPVGSGFGWFVIRDLYEHPDTRKRVSVSKTTSIQEKGTRGVAVVDLLKGHGLPEQEFKATIY